MKEFTPTLSNSVFSSSTRIGSGLAAVRGFTKYFRGTRDVVSSQTKTNTKMKTNYTYKDTIKNSSAKKRKVATVAAVKRMIAGVMEPKQIFINPFAVGFTLGTVHSYNITAQVLQGTADGNRTGDSINLSSVMIRYLYVTNTTANFYGLRVLLLMSSEEFNTANLSTAGLGISQVFGSPNTTIFNCIPNAKAVTILADQTYNMNSQIAGTTDGQTGIINHSFGSRKFDYQAAGSVFGKKQNLYLVVVADKGVAASTNAGDFLCHIRLKYLDS